MEKTTPSLWEAFLQNRSPELKRRLVVQYLDLVRYVVSKFGLHLQGRAHRLDYNDMVHFGVLGLLEAIERFTPSAGVKFETYAVPRVRGSILDEMRKLDWVPRSVRETSRKVGKAANEVMQEQGREPLDAEIAEKLSMGLDDYRKMIGGRTTSTACEAEILLEGESAGRMDEIPSLTPNPLECLSDGETRQLLIEAVEKLSERERTVIALYYYEELKFSEIGKLLSISEGRVSQIHSEVLRQLRQRLLVLES
jgi:RNA polymerase sigma factor for flagellar operon FliA